MQALEILSTRDGGGGKVRVTMAGVHAFNCQWPCSELRSNRAYWFEFDADGDLVDTDCPESDDGPASVALADDCKLYLFNGTLPEWVPSWLEGERSK